MKAIQFYNNEKVCEYTFDEVMAFSDEKLEACHDYIQWLFPLNEPSNYNPDAPILSQEEIDIFKTNQELKAKMIQALSLMCNFWGFENKIFGEGIGFPLTINNINPKITRLLAPTYSHNLLRITRVLKSLKLLGLSDLAIYFYEVLTTHFSEENMLNTYLYENSSPVVSTFDPIGAAKRARAFWKDAIVEKDPIFKNFSTNINIEDFSPYTGLSPVQYAQAESIRLAKIITDAIEEPNEIIQFHELSRAWKEVIWVYEILTTILNQHPQKEELKPWETLGE